MAHKDLMIRKYTFFSSSHCQLSHQSIKQIYKCSIKVVSHNRSHLDQPLVCLILLCLPALNLPLKQSQLPRCCFQSYLLFIESIQDRFFTTRTGQELSTKREFFPLKILNHQKVYALYHLKHCLLSTLICTKVTLKTRQNLLEPCLSFCQLNL